MKRILPALLLALAGCGGAAPLATGRAVDEPPGSPDDYTERIERLQGELAAALGSRATWRDDLTTGSGVRPSGQSLMEAQQPASAPLSRSVPDCDAAPELRDRICELAARICAIAARDRAQGDLQARCESARAACERARDDVAETCGD